MNLTRVLLGCGAVAGPLFVATFTAAGSARPAYDPMRHPVSSLALGPHAWIQRVNFGVNGVLYLAMAAGLARGRNGRAVPRIGPALVGAAGLGQITAGVFTTDPVSGYPPGTPPKQDGYSGAGALVHDIGAVPVFLGIPVMALACARTFLRHRRPQWAGYSAGTAAAMLVGFGLTSAAFAQTQRLVSIGGLLQRLTVTIGMGWLSALALESLATPRPRPRTRSGVRTPARRLLYIRRSLAPEILGVRQCPSLLSGLKGMSSCLTASRAVSPSRESL